MLSEDFFDTVSSKVEHSKLVYLGSIPLELCLYLHTRRIIHETEDIIIHGQRSGWRGFRLSWSLERMLMVVASSTMAFN